MDIHDTLQEAMNVLDSGRARAFGAGTVIDRDRMMELLVQARQSLPTEILTAAEVLSQRDEILSAAHLEAERIRTAANLEADQIRKHAEKERDYLVSEHEVLAEAHRLGEKVVAVSHERSAAMRAEVDDYVEAKLGSLAATLTRTLDAVQSGRQKVRANSAEVPNEGRQHSAV